MVITGYVSLGLYINHKWGDLLVVITGMTRAITVMCDD
jgi:hypothetical protein